jgi:LytR cell envelope-related transcriptional attenuator
MRLNARAWSWLGVGAAVVLAAGVTRAVLRTGHASAANQPATRTELPRRVTVEVLNSTRMPGIARVATALLRRAGLDVVYFGGADTTLRGRAHSEVLVRRGDTTGVGRIIAALGRATVIAAPDPSREVDLTVVIGTDFAQSKPAPGP